MEMTKEGVSELESWTMEIIGSEEQSIRDLWDIIRLTNLCIVGVPEGPERKGQSKYLKN